MAKTIAGFGVAPFAGGAFAGIFQPAQTSAAVSVSFLSASSSDVIFSISRSFNSLILSQSFSLSRWTLDAARPVDVSSSSYSRVIFSGLSATFSVSFLSESLSYASITVDALRPASVKSQSSSLSIFNAVRNFSARILSASFSADRFSAIRQAAISWASQSFSKLIFSISTAVPSLVIGFVSASSSRSALSTYAARIGHWLAQSFSFLRVTIPGTVQVSFSSQSLSKLIINDQVSIEVDACNILIPAYFNRVIQAVFIDREPQLSYINRIVLVPCKTTGE